MSRPATATPNARRGSLALRLRQDEEGATLIMGAFILVVLLTMAAFAIDLGFRVLGDRDIQGAVDLAALDAVQALGPLDDGTDLEARAHELALASLAENSGMSQVDAPEVTTQVGRFDDATRVFTPTLDDPDAVMVTATSTIDRVFGFVPGTSTLEHVGVAQLSEILTVEIGTNVLSVDSSRSELLTQTLSAMFNGPVTMDAVGYNGLADVGVPLDVLMTQLNVGSVEELLNAEIEVAHLLTVYANGLRSDGTGLTTGVATTEQTQQQLAQAAADIDALVAFIGDFASSDNLFPLDLTDGIGPLSYDVHLDASYPNAPDAPPVADNEAPDDISVTVTPQTTVRLGDIFQFDQGVPGSALKVALNAQDMVMATAMAMNTENVLDLQVDLASIPGVSDGTVTLHVVEPPQSDTGRAGMVGDQWRTVAETAQLRFGIDNLELGGFGAEGPIQIGAMRFPVGIDAGYGEAALKSFECNPDRTLRNATNQVTLSGAKMVFGANSPSVLLEDQSTGTPLTFASSGSFDSALLQLAYELELAPGVTVGANLLEVQVADGTDELSIYDYQDDHTLFGAFATTERIPGSPLAGEPFSLAGFYRQMVPVATFDPVPGQLEYPDLPDTLAPGADIIGVVDAADGSLEVRVSFDAETNVLTVYDALLSVPIFQTNVREDIILPLESEVTGRLAQIDELVLEPLYDVLGVATVGSADLTNSQDLCSIRNLVE